MSGGTAGSQGRNVSRGTPDAVPSATAPPRRPAFAPPTPSPLGNTSMGLVTSSRCTSQEDKEGAPPNGRGGEREGEKRRRFGASHGTHAQRGARAIPPKIIRNERMIVQGERSPPWAGKSVGPLGGGGGGRPRKGVGGGRWWAYPTSGICCIRFLGPSAEAPRFAVFRPGVAASARGGGGLGRQRGGDPFQRVREGTLAPPPRPRKAAAWTRWRPR